MKLGTAVFIIFICFILWSNDLGKHAGIFIKAYQAEMEQK